MRENSVLTRREFLAISGASAVLAGCATNPVTGRRQLMLFSEAQEISWDQEAAPHQFSAHYGAVQDSRLNDYVNAVGSSMIPFTHRPRMPYSFRVVNSPVVNGYTFPAGSVALCRGLMLEMTSEAQLAAVLGHELGHVSARHTGSRMSWGVVAQVGVVLLAAYLEQEKEKYAALGAGLGMIGANMLLCRYSREDERQADSLGMRYMAEAGYNPEGMAGLMQIFINLHKRKPSAVDLLFATHPMSDERFGNARREIAAKYAAHEGKEWRERYMDNTASLRKIGEAIRKQQDAEKEIMDGKYESAEKLLGQALKSAPGDYAGLLLMSKALHAQKKMREAEKYAARAGSVYPEEPQALHMKGMIKLEMRKFEAAYADFDEYEKRLPGNENTVYFKAAALDGQNKVEDAAELYLQYLKIAPAGEFSEPASLRLKELGFKLPGEGAV